MAVSDIQMTGGRQTKERLAVKDVQQWPQFSQYSQLDQARHEIRLLTILAGSEISEIKCTLEQVSFSDCGPYFALSYCWSTAEEPRQIILNNERICIRQNLWHFLWNLRKVAGMIRVWVDFLCINQTDVHERNHQVRLMAEDFSGAEGVYAWLGKSNQ